MSYELRLCSRDLLFRFFIAAVPIKGKTRLSHRSGLHARVRIFKQFLFTPDKEQKRTRPVIEDRRSRARSGLRFWRGHFTAALTAAESRY